MVVLYTDNSLVLETVRYLVSPPRMWESNHISFIDLTPMTSVVTLHVIGVY